MPTFFFGGKLQSLLKLKKTTVCLALQTNTKQWADCAWATRLHSLLTQEKEKQLKDSLVYHQKKKKEAKRFSLLLNANIVLPGKNDIVTSLGKIYGNLPLFRK